jgi:ferredoxin
LSFKVKVDGALCDLHGMCTTAAPEVFEIDDDDAEAVTVTNAEPDDDLRSKVEEAVDVCPVRAISIEG